MTLCKAVCGWLVIVLAALCLGSAETDAGPRHPPDLSAMARTSTN